MKMRSMYDSILKSFADSCPRRAREAVVLSVLKNLKSKSLHHSTSDKYGVGDVRFRSCLDKVKDGWKPGAISKRLLRALNKAKLQHSVVERIKTKKVKKRLENKPTLIVCKKDGQYRIEVNAAPTSKDGNLYTPLLYHVESANNKERVKRRDRKQRRLIKAAVENVWSDPYHPENCDRNCLPAYLRAIGANDIEREWGDNVKDDMSSCSCSDMDDITSSSSLDIDWEVQFSPPSAFQKQIPLDHKVNLI